MRHDRLWTTLTLLGVTIPGAFLFADTPVKPKQSSFGSGSSASRTPITQPMTVREAEKLVQFGEIPPVIEQVSETVTEKVTEKLVEKKVPVDYSVKAASIEVAWLQDAVTYPLRLRADSKPGEEAITLTGYVPSEPLRKKALAIAQLTADKLTLVDRLTVLPNMALPADFPVEPDQVQIVQNCIEKAIPGLGKSLQLNVDGNGVTTVSGRVDEFSDRLKLIRALQGIPGCTAIRYDLRVFVPAPVQQAVATVSMINPVTPAPSKLSIPPVVVPVVKVTTPETKVSAPTPTAKLPSPPRHVEQVTPATAPVSKTAPAIIQAGGKEAVQQSNDTIAASSLSGMFPPGMSGRSPEPGINLGSPVIVRASYEINLDINAKLPSQKQVLTQTSSLSQSSTSSVNPVQMPAPEQPALINVMPRLAK